MAKKQKTFEQKVNKGHALNDKYIKVVCSVKSDDAWKFKEKNVRVPDGENEDQIINTELAEIKATV